MRKICIYLRYIFVLVPIGSLYILYMCLSQIYLVREIDIRSGMHGYTTYLNAGEYRPIPVRTSIRISGFPVFG